jgi:hypothetical protein
MVSFIASEIAEAFTFSRSTSVAAPAAIAVSIPVVIEAKVEGSI